MKNVNRSLFLTIVFTVAALLVFEIAGYSQGATPNSSGTAQGLSTQALKVFSKAELQKYDGRDGRPAYIAVDGKVYDVSNVPAWKGGQHNGFKAGNDLSAAIKNAPHGTAVLKKLPVVGLYSGK